MAAKEWHGGELVYFGGTDYAMIGRTGGKQKIDPAEREALYPNLLVPNRVKSLMGIRIMFIASGPAATHCMAGDDAGRLYTWGRNEKGQLGHGDLLQRNVPTVVAALSDKFVTGASAGKNHSSCILKDGGSFSWGLNTHGQCGTGSVKLKAKEKDEILTTPHKSIVSHCEQVACGVEFTLWLCNGQVYAAGNGQYGVIGDNSDHSYNAKDSSIQILYEATATPKLITALAGHKIMRVAAGHTHCLAYDDAGSAYSWGNGGYGRLGHKVQQDEHKPRRIEVFANRNLVPKGAVLAAGATSSICTGVAGNVHVWGKLKSNGDNQTYPTMLMDLSGWNVRSFACGPGTFAAAADQSVITWGAATNGELGFGAGKKSSANPAKCEPLDGGYTHQVACGSGFTMCLLDPEHPKLAGLPVFESSAPQEEAVAGVEEAAGPSGKGAGAKRKAEAAAPAKGKGKKAK